MPSNAQAPPIDRRHDGPVETVNTGLNVADHEGVGPALDFMLSHGIDRTTALRVLAGPEFHRSRLTESDRRFRER